VLGRAGRRSLVAAVAGLAMFGTARASSSKASSTSTIGIIEGPVGTGVCDATHDNCVIIVNDGGSLTPGASVRIPISFAG
jgi:hypothetical protein